MGGEDNDVMPVFQSRLRAKKEERMHQRQQEQVLPCSTGLHRNLDMRDGPESSSLVKDAGTRALANAHQQAVADSGEDTVKRRERSEARKRVIEYHGSIWDAVSSDNLDMVRNYFLVEGATMVLRRRHPDADQGGRTLLHCASWHGYGAIVEFILTTGCDVDVVDSVASKTTALIEAARAGHAGVCVTLLRYGASPRHRDSYGDTAFHWAGRQGHGTVLLRMALEQERLEPGSTPALWVMKNHKSRTVVDLVQPHTFVVPLLQKRLGDSFTRALESAKGKRRSRFPVRAAVMGTRKSTLVQANSRPEHGLIELGAIGLEAVEPAVTSLSGVEKLGLDVSSFAYVSRDR
ncbi:Ankyrin repeats (many copies) [Phytophthora infestans]|uniref:Ankyrin repeats (Many copies) n=1 Tax=Phytophthora infestans TaxID=4787 RepID=A0A8S9TSI2_PHYIN|nr:Ankyrin repeats (many copies) [Phytophthora infestans]